MIDVDVQDTLKLLAAAGQEPIEAVAADGADAAFGERVCLRCAKRAADDLDALAAEDLVEGNAELAVAVVDEIPDSIEQAGEAEVARLLGYPGARRVGRAASEVDAAALEFDEEEHVEA